MEWRQIDSHAYIQIGKRQTRHTCQSTNIHLYGHNINNFFLLLLYSMLLYVHYVLCSRSPFRSCPFPNYIIVHLEYIWKIVDTHYLSLFCSLFCYSLQNGLTKWHEFMIWLQCVHSNSKYHHFRVIKQWKQFSRNEIPILSSPEINSNFDTHNWTID